MMIFIASRIAQLYADNTNATAHDRGGPMEIFTTDHAYGETWQLDVFEFTDVGVVGLEDNVGSVTITASETTTPFTITSPTGTNSGTLTVDYTCDNADDRARDILVEYSENSGGAWSEASVVAVVGGGVINGGMIEGATCDGTTSTSFDWDSLLDEVAIGATLTTVQLRITTQQNTAASAATSDFTVTNAIDLCAAGGDAADDHLTAAELSYDYPTNTAEVAIIGCDFIIDGAHTFAGLHLRDGATLTHSQGTIDHMNITIDDGAGGGDVSIASGSSIDLDEKGCLGSYGYDDNSTPTNTSDDTCVDQGGEGYGGDSGHRGGGAGHGGQGGDGNEGTDTGGSSYGSHTAPLFYGAGGGYIAQFPPQEGGAGGGAIQLDVPGTLTLDGSISATGGIGIGASEGRCSGGGAGGSINISADTLEGSGSIEANGGWTIDYIQDAGGGAGGRIAVYYDDSTYSGSYDAYGDFGHEYGGAGTILLDDNDDGLSASLTLDNDGNSGTLTELTEASLSFEDLIIQDGARLSTTYAGTSTLTVNNLSITNDSELITTGGDTTLTVNTSLATMTNSRIIANDHQYALTLNVPTLDLDTGSELNVSRLTLNATNVDIDGTSSISGDEYGCPTGYGYNTSTDVCVDQGGEGYVVTTTLARSGGGGHAASLWLVLVEVDMLLQEEMLFLVAQVVVIMVLILHRHTMVLVVE